MTSFVGRRSATGEVKQLLSKGRLVTLTGAGGTGKSRLALHVGRNLRRTFSDGVWLIELAAVRNPALLGDTIATALGLADRSSRDPENVLSSYLADKRLLLVLDNCEHLSSECAHLTDALLRAAPGLRVLATSREPLGIAGEQLWQVPPLSVPPPADSIPEGGWEQYEALTLLEARATAVTPHFTLDADNLEAAARLCQQLDGLPLAIELAAVRLRIMSVTDVLTRLENRFRLLSSGNRAAPSRHQTLRAAVDWSYDLCSGLERTLWARLSVFTGAFSLAAAEQVCVGDGVRKDDVLDGVTGLVDKSLLVRNETGNGAPYRMLETIREYGQQRLTGKDGVMVRCRHRDYYLRLAEQAQANWFGPDQVEWLDRFQAEKSNVQAALEFCISRPTEVRTGLRMTGSLLWYWIQRDIRDGRAWLDRALAADTEPSRERAKALRAVGWISNAQGDTGHALAGLDEAVALARNFDDEQGLGFALQFIGLGKFLEGKLPEAAAAYEQALKHYRSTGTVNSTRAVGLAEYGTIVALQGDQERAVTLCRESVALCRDQGEQWACAWGLMHLAIVHWLRGDLTEVGAHAKEALRLRQILRDHPGIAWCVEISAWVAAAKDEPYRAAVLFGIADTMWAEIGQWLGTWQTGRDVSNHAQHQARQALGRSEYDAAFRQGRSFTGDAAIAYTLDERPAPPLTAAAAGLSQLTRREREVATLVAEGMANKEIAVKLVIARRTAEAHVENILTKLGFTSRVQIAAWVNQQHG
ncbi:ATP-binding protein [Amycolatopsis pigmentata]|uniref:ATP-binding protein n=1 Tax=Amycolatopsis pigmentata TaxID=450801 RepID=A0ABW5G7T0_9PSEU